MTDSIQDQKANLTSKKVFNFPLKTFDPEHLLDEMLNAKDGTVFILGEKNIGKQIGDNSVELTIAQIKKVSDTPNSGVGKAGSL